MINFIKDAVSAVSGIKTFLFNTDYRNNFDLQNVEFPCCVLTPIMRTNYDLKNIIRESAELQLSVVDLAPYEYSGDDLYAINKRCSDLALQVIANLQVKSKLDKELTFEFILPSGDELISGVMCNLQCTMKQGSCIGAPSYVEIVVQPIKRESITSNGKHVISPSSGFTAMKEVEVDVNVDLKGSLQDKQVTITENGTQIITADEGYEGLNSVEVNSEVYEGFDLTEFGLSTSDKNDFNKFYRECLNFSKDFWENKKNATNWDNIAYRQNMLMFIPKGLPAPVSLNRGFMYTSIYSIENLDLSNLGNDITNCTINTAFSGVKLNTIKKYFNFKRVVNAKQVFYCSTILSPPEHIVFDIGNFEDFPYWFDNNEFFRDCYVISSKPKKIEIIGNRMTILNHFFAFTEIASTDELYIPNSENLTRFDLFWGTTNTPRLIKLGSIKSCIAFANLPDRTTQVMEFDDWKEGNISLKNMPNLFSSAIHYDIQNAMSVADGATTRTLQLHATAKENWEASEFYEQDLTVLMDKGITIA